MIKYIDSTNETWYYHRPSGEKWARLKQQKLRKWGGSTYPVAHLTPLSPTYLVTSQITNSRMPTIKT